jgi:hypothetical protein
MSRELVGTAAPALPNSCTSARWRYDDEGPGCVGLITTVHLVLPAGRRGTLHQHARGPLLL